MLDDITRQSNDCGLVFRDEEQLRRVKLLLFSSLGHKIVDPLISAFLSDPNWWRAISVWCTGPSDGPKLEVHRQSCTTRCFFFSPSNFTRHNTPFPCERRGRRSEGLIWCFRCCYLCQARYDLDRLLLLFRGKHGGRSGWSDRTRAGHHRYHFVIVRGKSGSRFGCCTAHRPTSQSKDT